MRDFPNIEKSGFRPREYVGYANGVWRIRKRSGKQGWRADQGAHVICGTTLADISQQLANIAARHRAAAVCASLPNPWAAQ